MKRAGSTNCGSQQSSCAGSARCRLPLKSLERLSLLSPTNTDARVGLAEMCLQAGFSDLALKYAADVRASGKRLHTGERELLIQTEGWAYVARNDLATAEKVLQEAQAKYPLDELAYATLA